MSTIPPEVSFKLMSLMFKYGVFSLAYRVAHLICAHDEPISLDLRLEKEGSTAYLNTPIEPGKQSGEDEGIWRSMARVIRSKMNRHDV